MICDTDDKRALWMPFPLPRRGSSHVTELGQKRAVIIWPIHDEHKSARGFNIQAKLVREGLEEGGVSSGGQSAFSSQLD